MTCHDELGNERRQLIVDGAAILQAAVVRHRLVLQTLNVFTEAAQVALEAAQKRLELR